MRTFSNLWLLFFCEPNFPFFSQSEGCGLTLADVEYHPENLEEATHDFAKLPIGPVPRLGKAPYPEIDW